MKTLSQHIEYLLIRKECVILPGLGAFIATDRSALIDNERRTILPPTREISFNTGVKSDDGMLAHSISRSQGCSFEEGRGIVATLIGELRMRLETDGRAELGRIGTLAQDSERHIQFEPAYTKERLQKLYGLRNIGFGKTEVAKDTPGADSVQVIGKDPRYYYLKVRKRAVNIAAMLVTVIGVCLAFILPSDEKQSGVSQRYASVVPVESITNVVHKSADCEKPKTIKEEEPMMADVPEYSEDTETELKEDTYYLIIGTFATERGARKYIEMTDAEGLELCGSRTGIWRVSAGKSSDREELQARMNDKEFRSQYPGSWIWEKK